MKFIEQISTLAQSKAAATRVKGIYIGLSYCLAVLEDGNSGLAFVFKDDLVAGCNIGLPARPLAGRTAQELLEFAGRGILANSIALAVANALFAPLVSASSHGDFIDQFPLSSGTRVGMVGHFGPLEPVIRQHGAELFIFDQHPAPFSTVIHEDKIPEILPSCDIAIITATSIINETFDTVLEHAAHCGYVAVIGPSTPLLPECYQQTPVSCAGGAVVRDSGGMIQSVVEAGGMRVFSKYLDKVNVVISERGVDG